MDILETIRQELRREAQSIEAAAQKVSESAAQAVELIYNCPGKIVVTGMGKTGIIGRKIAATLASTGTTAIYLHPAEGIHGDLGMVQTGDVVIAISYSGNTSEVIQIIPYLHFHKIPIIAITGNLDSQLANSAEVVLDGSVPAGFEPFGLVPTCSTTVALALGDALAVALLKKRDFREEDFARFHPGGTIGRKLLLKTSDLMHTGSAIPLVNAQAGLDLVVLEMTGKKLGCTCVTEDNGVLCGIVTDGDLRRLISRGIIGLQQTAREIMTPAPATIQANALAVDALNLMEDKKITVLPVVDLQKIPTGIIHMHDLIQAGVVG
ncbi:MAG: KpsF/GutQ family sugar-phosphate isomerase [Candidatus Cloacimonetes bacterium]|nr:KpsF/GutQ family sugar-phosphate isomerase [Candidatus Cloacimonadota bacterium]